ncbi:MAG TPA: hypothetical protein VNW73_16505 [Ktedonobacteraceae bacterium]|nr:hypothetical protein [Ktedonobacteraceae bacterium]
MHFSETCDEELPRLITQVATTIAPTPDRYALPETHAVLEQRELLEDAASGRRRIYVWMPNR